MSRVKSVNTEILRRKFWSSLQSRAQSPPPPQPLRCWTFVVWRWWETTSTVFHHQIKACDIVHDSHHWCFWTFTGFEPGKMADSDNVTASGRTKHEEVWRFHSLKQNYAAWLLVSFIEFACDNISDVMTLPCLSVHIVLSFKYILGFTRLCLTDIDISAAEVLFWTIHLNFVPKMIKSLLVGSWPKVI